MKKLLFLISAVFFMCVAIPSTAFTVDGQTPTIVRVCIIDDKDSINLSLKGNYRIYAYKPERLLMDGPSLSARVSGTKEGLVVGSREIKTPEINVKVEYDGNVYVDGRRFRGNIDIIRKDNGKLMVVNRLPLDEYLYGVLYHEVSHRWPMEVLKAQAIAARTFALQQVRQSKNQPYDLRSDIYSQVYGGRTSEKWSTTMAVDKTRGEILTYKGDIFPAYYHATCGGYTEDASNLWNVDMPPLKGVDCTFCTNSPHYRWTKDVPLFYLENKLKDNGYKIGRISSVAILSKNKSGRVDKIEIKDAAGTVIVLTGKDFRQIFGPNELRSAKFDLSMRSDLLVIQGIGWGHGVGMCQWGAYGMAKKGKKVDEILKHYYPGAEISTMDKIKL
ncbi:MAG: SpoIID/LytB domain-containing protein [Candidatus Omnitrophota bacterium]